MTTYKHHEIDSDKVRTIVRSRLTGSIYISPYYWKDPVTALNCSTIIDDPPNFIMPTDKQVEELRIIFGDIPEYPGEYIELEGMKP